MERTYRWIYDEMIKDEPAAKKSAAAVAYLYRMTAPWIGCRRIRA
jgi:hypothetical protein